MSYGSTLATKSPGTSEKDYEEVLEMIKNHIYQINGATNRLNKSMTTIGTVKDNSAFRDSIHDSNTQTNTVIKETKRMMVDLERKFYSDRSKRRLIDRLQQNFKDACENNASTQKKVLRFVQLSLFEYRIYSS